MRSCCVGLSTSSLRTCPSVLPCLLAATEATPSAHCWLPRGISTTPLLPKRAGCYIPIGMKQAPEGRGALEGRTPLRPGSTGSRQKTRTETRPGRQARRGHPAHDLPVEIGHEAPRVLSTKDPWEVAGIPEPAWLSLEEQEAIRLARERFALSAATGTEGAWWPPHPFSRAGGPPRRHASRCEGAAGLPSPGTPSAWWATAGPRGSVAARAGPARPPPVGRRHADRRAAWSWAARSSGRHRPRRPGDDGAAAQRDEVKEAARAALAAFDALEADLMVYCTHEAEGRCDRVGDAVR